MLYPNGSESVLSPGPWSQLVKVRGAVCSDGVPRTATVTGQPTTAFSIPARVKARGKTISGYLTMAPTYIDGVKEGWIFRVTLSGVNATVLPLAHPWEIG